MIFRGPIGASTTGRNPFAVGGRGSASTCARNQFLGGKIHSGIDEQTAQVVHPEGVVQAQEISSP